MSKKQKITLDHSTWSLVKRLAREGIRPYTWRIVGAMVCMALTAAATAAYAFLMDPVINRVFVDKDPAMLWPVGLAVVTSFAIKGFATYGGSVLMSNVGLKIVADMQARVFDHLMRMDLGFFHANSTGKLISRLTNDINMMRGAVSNALTGIGKDTLSVAFLVGVMFYQDWKLAAISFFVFPIAILPIVRIGKRMRRVTANTQEQVGQFMTALEQSFQGVRVVKAYRMEGYESSRIGVLVDSIFRLTFKATRTRATSSPIMETLGGLAITVVVIYGGSRVIEGATTAGAFLSFITALMLAYQPMKALANLNSNLQEGLASAQRIFDLLDVRAKINTAPDAKPLVISGGAIRFEHVSFAYEGAEDRNAVRDLSIDVPAGRTVALVGMSGAGKSTVLNLIPRFYDVSEGRVLVDGQDIREVTIDSLRRQISLVSQEITMFDDTIRANIAYGRPEASQEELEQAARHAAAHDFIMALPEGYDTMVGERGVKLSGGQRQRLSIARAMLKNAPILLLDEATSALDTESERHVQAALEGLMRGRTTLVIAHRLSTIVKADVIHVLDQGRLIESGSHDELMAKGAAYARLYSLQFGESETPKEARV